MMPPYTIKEIITSKTLALIISKRRNEWLLHKCQRGQEDCQSEYKRVGVYKTKRESVRIANRIAEVDNAEIKKNSWRERHKTENDVIAALRRERERVYADRVLPHPQIVWDTNYMLYELLSRGNVGTKWQAVRNAKLLSIFNVGKIFIRQHRNIKGLYLVKKECEYYNNTELSIIQKGVARSIYNPMHSIINKKALYTEALREFAAIRAPITE